MLFLLDGHVCLAKLSVLIFGILVLESEVLSLKATGRVKREGKNHFPISSLPKPENVTKRTGKSVKLRLKAILASGTGHWTKNYEPVEQSKSVVIGNNANVSWLRIKNLHTSDSGLYAFTVNHTIMKQWRLHVTKENRKDPPGIEHPCGKADPDLGSDCLPFSQTSHPNCTSFPGRPFNVTVHYLIYKRNLYVQAQWKPPKQGNNDLWGYQVYISGMIGHPGFANCLQINKKVLTSIEEFYQT